VCHRPGGQSEWYGWTVREACMDCLHGRVRLSAKGNRATRDAPRQIGLCARDPRTVCRDTNRPVLKYGPSTNLLPPKTLKPTDRNTSTLELMKNSMNTRRTLPSRTVCPALEDCPPLTCGSSALHAEAEPRTQ
jgi:hypothetical protein